MFRVMNSCTKEMSFFPSSFILQTDSLHEDAHHQPQISLNPNFPPPQDLHGIGSFLGKRSMSFSADIHHHEENFQEESNGNLIVHSRGDMEDMSDDEDGLSQAGGEKKKRLNIEQVKMLEKNFELGNKLEPDRKLQLARYLGLQPRQIAIWFQNRRARWKTKQLEKDYDLLKRQFDAIKAENDSLQSQNQKLQAQILTLKNRDPAELINLNKETEESCSNTSENSSDVNLDISKKTRPTIDSRSSALFPSNDCDFKEPSNVVHRLIENHNNTDISLSSRPPEIQPQKVDQQPHHYLSQTVREESFTNMLCGVDDQAGLWPWFEQHDFT